MNECQTLAFTLLCGPRWSKQAGHYGKCSCKGPDQRCPLHILDSTDRQNLEVEDFRCYLALSGHPHPCSHELPKDENRLWASLLCSPFRQHQPAITAKSSSPPSTQLLLRNSTARSHFGFKDRNKNPYCWLKALGSLLSAYCATSWSHQSSSLAQGHRVPTCARASVSSVPCLSGVLPATRPSAPALFLPL